MSKIVVLGLKKAPLFFRPCGRLLCAGTAGISRGCQVPVHTPVHHRTAATKQADLPSSRQNQNGRPHVHVRAGGARTVRGRAPGRSLSRLLSGHLRHHTPTPNFPTTHSADQAQPTPRRAVAPPRHLVVRPTPPRALPHPILAAPPAPLARALLERTNALSLAASPTPRRHATPRPGCHLTPRRVLLRSPEPPSLMRHTAPHSAAPVVHPHRARRRARPSSRARSPPHLFRFGRANQRRDLSLTARRGA